MTIPIAEFEAPADWLAGRRVLITGACGVLGSELARRAAAVGADLILLARKRAQLEAIDDELQAAGASPPTLVELDLAHNDPAPFHELAQALEADGLDALVLCAARLHGLQPLDHLSPMELAQTLNTNLTANVLLLQALTPLLRRSPSGRIIAITDADASTGQAYRGAYAMSKAGLDALISIAGQENEGRLSCALFAPPPMASPIRAAMRLDYTRDTETGATLAARSLLYLLGTGQFANLKFDCNSKTS